MHPPGFSYVLLFQERRPVLLRCLRRRPAPQPGTLRWAPFLRDEKWGKNRLGRSPLRTSLGCEAAPAVVLRPARDPCCGPCYCYHTRLSWRLALSPGGFHLRAYLGKRRSRRREPGCPSLGTAAYQGKALGSRSTIRQRSRCCLSCLQAIYVTHPGPGPKPGGRRCIPYRGVDSTRRGKAPPLVGLW